MNDLGKRLPLNPLIRPSDLKPSRPDWQVEGVLNPGVFRFDNRTWLLVRVAERPPQRPGYISVPAFSETGEPRVLEFDRKNRSVELSDPRVLRHEGTDYLTTLSHLRLFESHDGVHFVQDPAYPLLRGSGPSETFGIEDCRVSRIDSSYYLTYTAVSPQGVAVGMRSTSDWKTFDHHGIILPPHNKDCALFEEPSAGRFFALHRPSSPQIGGNYIWLSQSPDLLHWGNHRCLARTRPGMWDSARVGAGAAPIRTDRGWLAIYHGADEQNRYGLGAMLLDSQNPARVLARSHDPIMQPCADYEKQGLLGNVVFTNGHIVDGDDVTVYYGASDTVVCGARLSVREVLASLNRSAA